MTNLTKKNQEFIHIASHQLKQNGKTTSEIAEKDKQLDQQQQLTLAAMEDSKKLELALNEAKAEVEEFQNQKSQEEKKGFFARLFKK